MEKNIVALMLQEYENFTRSERKIADYVLEHQKETQYISITDLSAVCDVAVSTISVFCRKLKLAGFNDFKLELEDFPRIAEVKDGDSFLVTVAQGEVQTMADPEILAGSKITTFQRGGYVVTGGTQYDFASAAEFEMDTLYDYTATDNAVVNLKDINYNVYLDKYGYAIGIEIIEEPDQYVFLTGIDLGTSNLNNKTAEGNVIFLDGTMDTVTIKLKDSKYADNKDMTVTDDDHSLNSLMNTWCKYTNNKNGDYVLTEVANTATLFNAPKNKAASSSKKPPAAAKLRPRLLLFCQPKIIIAPPARKRICLNL